MSNQDCNNATSMKQRVSLASESLSENVSARDFAASVTKQILTEKDYERIRRQAIGCAKRSGHQSIAEDFAQECCLYALERQIPEVYVDRRLTDYLRKHNGRTGTPGGDARSFAIHTTKEYDDKAHGFQPRDGCDHLDIPRMLNGIERHGRLIYALYHKHEMAEAAIADCCGVTESRISQIISGIQKTLDQRAARQKSDIPQTRESKMEGLLPTSKQRLEQQTHYGMAHQEPGSLEGFDEEGF